MEVATTINIFTIDTNEATPGEEDIYITKTIKEFFTVLGANRYSRTTVSLRQDVKKNNLWHVIYNGDFNERYYLKRAQKAAESASQSK